MKTITLLAATALVWVNTATAAANLAHPATFSLDEPIEFTERGITFFVFATGDFDFNTVQTAAQPLYYRGQNTTYGAPQAGVRIEHDAMGRVRRVGNVFLNYDAMGRIRRIGNVYMTYRRMRLVQVGNLSIVHDRWGAITAMNGCVNDGWAPMPPRQPQYENENDDTIYYRNAHAPSGKR